ncbi:MAG: hypothetical protein FWE89_02935, partial [Syntrophaceae bacterium]|nr:hypothetical protein [Syntrophaceae bacterium]
AAKHRGAKPDKRLGVVLKARAEGGSLGCPAAEKLTAELGVAMAAVGRNADLLEIRINCCQLGLFGHSKEEKVVRPAPEVPCFLETEIRRCLEGGRLPCAAVWEIADLREMPRIEVAAACEKLGIKIKPCQLGAF